MKNPARPRLGLIPANRAVFSMELAADLRARTLAVMEDLDFEVVVPDASMTRRGCVETREEAELVGRLLRESDVEGVVIGAMNFGDEQSVALSLKRSGLNVPIFVFGGQEEGILTLSMERRDSFCGLISICEVLREIGYRYTLPSRPIGFPEDVKFRSDLRDFAAVCRVVSGVRSARIGQIGARPDPFWTCRFSEKALQRLGPTVVTLDLSEVVARVRDLPDDDAGVHEIIRQMEGSVDFGDATAPVRVTMAKLEATLTRIADELGVDAMAIQCWTALQQNLGVCSCTAMARLGEEGVPCACEADVLGALSMYALQLAGGRPAALADWNNLHPEDPEVVNLWHCGVLPPSFLGGRPTIRPNDNLAKVLPRNKSIGTLQGTMAPGSLTVARVAELEEGAYGVVLGEGEVIDMPGRTYGAYGWTRIPGLEALYRDVILQYFPHHVALTSGNVGNIIYEATVKYLGFKPFFHGQSRYGEAEAHPPFSS